MTTIVARRCAQIQDVIDVHYRHSDCVLRNLHNRNLAPISTERRARCTKAS
jgi:hypothetical protein